MSGKYLLDTNIVIALFAEDLSVKKHIAKAGEIFIPAPEIKNNQSEEATQNSTAVFADYARYYDLRALNYS